MDDPPGSMVTFIAVRPSDIKPEGVGGGFGEELLARGEPLHLIELILDQPMHGLDIRLPGMGGRGDRRVGEPGNSLDGPGEGTVRAGIPGPDELTAVIGLDAAAGEVHATALQVGEQDLGEEGRIGQGAFLRVGEELQPAHHLPGRVLDLGEPILADLGPQFGDVDEVFGIDVHLLTQPPGGLDGAQVLLGLMFAPFPLEEPGLPPVSPDRLLAERQIEVALDPGRAPRGQTTFQCEDAVTEFRGDASGWGHRRSGVILQPLQAPGLPPGQPFANGLGCGPEGARRGLDPPLARVADQFQTEIGGLFTLAHDRVVWNRTHRSSDLLLCVTDFQDARSRRWVQCFFWPGRSRSADRARRSCLRS